MEKNNIIDWSIDWVIDCIELKVKTTPGGNGSSRAETPAQ